MAFVRADTARGRVGVARKIRRRRRPPQLVTRTVGRSMARRARRVDAARISLVAPETADEAQNDGG
jgi:hypothetical protein